MTRAAAGTCTLPSLDEVAAETVQRRGQPFSTFVADTSNSRILRGYVRRVVCMMLPFLVRFSVPALETWCDLHRPTSIDMTDRQYAWSPN